LNISKFLFTKGWLNEMQMETIRINKEDKFQLLKNFGFDLAGAVYIETTSDYLDLKKKARYSDSSKSIIENHASISGIQKKILIIKENNIYRPTIDNELSTHIAKLESDELENIIELEYLSNVAMKKLLPNDRIVDVEVVDDLIFFNNEKRRALIVTRFDRENNNRIHFEEFNQLLDKYTEDKYSFSYEDMGKYILEETLWAKDEVLKLYKRILACFVIGNTDAHLKNFAIFIQNGILTHQTPMYDVVYSSYYKEFNTLALRLDGCKDLEITEIKPKQIINLGMNGFKLGIDDIIKCVDELVCNIDKAVEEVSKSEIKAPAVKDKLIQMMIKRKNGTFLGVEKYAQKKKNLKH
jgi:serine/threonine-protein kinase HipA